jgi:hypothetical protein
VQAACSGDLHGSVVGWLASGQWESIVIVGN